MYLSKISIFLFAILSVSSCNSQSSRTEQTQDSSNIEFIDTLSSIFSVYEKDRDLLAVFFTEGNKQLTSFKYHTIDIHFTTNNLFCKYRDFNGKSGLDIILPDGDMKTIENVAYLKEEHYERIVFCLSSNDFGVIDPNGNIIVEAGLYKDIRDYHDSLAVVKDQNNNYGFMDVNGKVVIPFKYKQVDSFIDGIALVQTKDASYLIDKDQNILVTGPKEAQRWPEMPISKQPPFYQMGFFNDPDVKYYNLKGEEIANPKKGLFKN